MIPLNLWRQKYIRSVAVRWEVK